MHKIKKFFRNTEVESEVQQKEQPYPWSLERHYKVSKKILGTGTFAVVKECTDKRTGVNYALKIINKAAIQGEIQKMSDMSVFVLRDLN
jgi:calcium/calmodulin-dependent protein kinase I